MTNSLKRGRRDPARSTMLPQNTLPTAPSSTTMAARTAACSGGRPWKRLRKLGNHDHTADTTTSCAAPPRQTHSIVRDLASDLATKATVLPVERVTWFSAGVSATVL